MTAADRAGPELKIRSEEVLWRGWATLTRYVLDLRLRDGAWRTITREVQNHGDAVCVLPVDPARGTVLLVRQFRLAAYLGGHDGMLLEACAGLIDAGETSEAAVAREAEEELGYRLHDLGRVHEAFVGPGAVSERMVYFTARYTPADHIAAGGGAAHEGEDIEVVEMGLEDAFAAMADGRIVDAKTIILLQHVRLAALGGAP